MKSIKLILSLLAIVFISLNGYCQLWKKYADSAKAYEDQKNMEKAIEYYYKGKDKLMKDSMWTNSHAILCNSMADVYRNMKQYEKAEPLFLEAKNIREKIFGKGHPVYASSSNNLAILYEDMGQYEKAESLYIEAKNIREKALGKEHQDYAASCFDLGIFYKITGKYDKAELFSLEAKYIREKVLGKEHPAYAASCNSLAVLYYYYFSQTLKAESLWKESKEILEKTLGKMNPDYATICSGLANIYRGKSEYTKAESLFLEAKQIREKLFGKEHPDYAAACNNLGVLYSDIGQYEKAEAFFKEAKQVREKALGKEHPDYAASCFNLGNLYKNRNQYEKSELFYTEAREVWRKLFGKEHLDYATGCNSLAILYSKMNRYEKAESLFIETKQIRERLVGKEHLDYASSCNNLAILYTTTGQYQKAEPLWIEAKQVRAKMLGKDHPDYGTICNNLANLYSNMGQYGKAEPLFLEAKGIREKTLGKDHSDYARSCDDLASLYRSIGKYSKAETLYLEAKKIREKMGGKDNPDYAGICNNLAVLYFDMGQYEKAESLYLESKIVAEKTLGKDDPHYASYCNNLAVLYRNMGQYEKAEILYAEARNIIQKVFGKEHFEYASNCNNLAALYMYMGQYQRAEPFLIEAKLIRAKTLGKEHPDYATSCLNLANFYSEMGEYQKAESLYFEDKNISEKAFGKEHPEYAESCDALAELYKDIGQYERAEPLYLEAKQIREKTLGKEHPDYGVSCNALADLYWNMGHYEKANTYFTEALGFQSKQIQKIFQFTSEIEKQSYLKEIKANNNSFFSFNYSDRSGFHQGVAYNLSLSSRNLILSSSQQLRSSIYSTTDTSIQNKYNNWISSRNEISFLYAKPIADHPDYVKDLEEKANTLEKELTRLSSSFKDQQTKNNISWQTVQQTLRSNEAAIEFIELDFYNGKRWTDSTYYIALILRKDKPEPEMVQLFEKKELDTLLSNTENLAIDNRINSLYTGNNSLYDLTWKPLEKYLNGISKVHFASAGNLFKLSFAALPVNDKQVLGDKYQLIQLNTTAAVANNTQSLITASDKIQLYGGIQYDADSATLKQSVSLYQSSTANSRSLPDDLARGAGFQYLPGTRREAEEVKKQAGNASTLVTILSGTNATEESVKVLNGKNSPSVLHIATHGFFFPDPKDDKRDDIQKKFESSGKPFKQSDNPLFRSALLFAGANNAWQGKPIEGIEDGILTAYEVSNLYFPNTKLVVLSACETALGDIQGSEGVYGLQRAFKMAGVQNLVMSLWKVPDNETAEFMQLFYKNLFAKQAISNAFYNAQQVMKNKYRAEPYKWAAWVLVR